MRKVKDGWHTVCGYRVYCEDGLVLRGVNLDHTRGTHVYRYKREGGWDREDRITVSAFRAGVRRGTIKMA